MEKNASAYFFTIFLAENVLRIVEPGTHDFNKYINLTDLESLAFRAGLESLGFQHTFFNPLSNKFFYTNKISTNYLVCFRKPVGDAQPHATSG